MDNLTFTVTPRASSDIFRECWDVYTLFDASAVYNDVTYKAWGTDEDEAKQKVIDLIKLDKVNGIKRTAGEVVE